MAVGFGTLLNILLATTLVWTGWIEPEVRVMGWVVLGAVWIGSVAAARNRPRRADSPAGPGAGMASAVAGQVASGPGGEKTTEDLFSAAQAEYLQGNWFETEAVLRRMIEADARDADAMLMLATLFRHTDRLDEAAGTLRRLETLDGSTKWSEEIRNEWTLMAVSETIPTPD